MIAQQHTEIEHIQNTETFKPQPGENSSINAVWVDQLFYECYQNQYQETSSKLGTNSLENISNK